MKPDGTLLLTRKQISELLRFSDYFTAVEAAFKAHAENCSTSQGLMHLDSHQGEFHVKGGGLRLEKNYFAFKINGGFYQNSKLRGLPNIIGTIALCDGESGYPLAIMNSGEITRQRTAAAAAVAAKHLARTDAETTTICGCGTQGQAQLSAMKWLLPRKENTITNLARLYDRLTRLMNTITVDYAETPGPAVSEELAELQKQVDQRVGSFDSLVNTDLAKFNRQAVETGAATIYAGAARSSGQYKSKR